MMTVPELRVMFEQVNLDCAKTGESVVPLTDVDYYTDQIVNIFGVSYDEAEELASQLAD